MIVISLLGSSRAWAATVTTTADDGPGSLRNAIANAAPGETIDFSVSGTIELSSGELLITKNLIIAGPGAGSLTVQRSTAPGTPDFRIFNITAGSVRIAGLTVSKGRAATGGGINNARNLIIEDCAISDNTATESGGGINNSGTLKLDRTTITGNFAQAVGAANALGGGINNISTIAMDGCLLTDNAASGGPSGGGGFGGAINNVGTITNSNSVFIRNSATGGATGSGFGGAINNSISIILTNAVISNNSAVGGPDAGDSAGGGIHNDGTVRLVDSSVTGNSAMTGATGGSPAGASRGGGIANELDTVQLLNSTISSNTAVGSVSSGGGINNIDGGNLSVDNSTISRNSVTANSGAAGGGFFNDSGGSVTINHSTVTENSAGEGSGIFNGLVGTELKNTIVAGNIGGVDFFNSESGIVASDGFNLIGRVMNASFLTTDKTLVTTEDLRLGPLQDNGGPKFQIAGESFGPPFTHALLCGSVAIDAGDNTDAPPTDQRGFPRIVDGVIDIGAYEGGSCSNTAPVANGQNVKLEEDTDATITLSGSDVETCDLTFSIVTAPTNGTLSVITNIACVAGTPNSDSATVVYTPAANYYGADSFTFKVNDGTVDSEVATVSITVAEVNDPPTANADIKNATENTELNFPAGDLTANDSAGPANESDQTLTVTAVGNASHGTVTLVNGTITYTPEPGYNGQDSFTYIVMDNGTTDGIADPRSATATVNVTVAQGPAQGCDLYPIALSERSLDGVPVGGVVRDIYNGVQPGNFGWLTWAGSPSEPTLATGLTPPGDSATYVNPMDQTDRVVSQGDWVQGKPGISNSDDVREALDALEQIDITVPVWDRAIKTGNNSLYRVTAFARVRLVSYRLPRENRITAMFLGFTDCP
jgi:hypothetical protein